MEYKIRPECKSLKQKIDTLKKRDKINNPYRKTLIEIKDIKYKEYGFISGNIYTWKILGEGIRNEKYLVIIELTENGDYSAYLIDLDTQCRLGQITKEDLCMEYNN